MSHKSDCNVINEDIHKVSVTSSRRKGTKLLQFLYDEERILGIAGFGMLVCVMMTM
jgi:hypothetical protein